MLVTYSEIGLVIVVANSSAEGHGEKKVLSTINTNPFSFDFLAFSNVSYVPCPSLEARIFGWKMFKSESLTMFRGMLPSPACFN